jgi:hypothetical protein
MSVEPIAGTSAEFSKLVLEEKRKWADVVSRANIRVE